MSVIACSRQSTIAFGFVGKLLTQRRSRAETGVDLPQSLNNGSLFWFFIASVVVGDIALRIDDRHEGHTIQHPRGCSFAVGAKVYPLVMVLLEKFKRRLRIVIAPVDAKENQTLPAEVVR